MREGNEFEVLERIVHAGNDSFVDKGGISIEEAITFIRNQ